MPSVYVIEGQDDLEQMLEGLVADFEGFTSSQDGREWAEESNELARDGMRESLEQFQSPSGVAHAPNAPSTIRKKGHGKQLHDTLRLKNSLTVAGHPDAATEIYAERDRCGFTTGTSVPYSGFNQNGTGRIPARPHVGFTEKAIDESTELGADKAIEHLKAGA